MEKVYIALDIEASGPRVGVHSMLSIGACIVPREPLSYDWIQEKGLGFYAEIHPASLNFSHPEIRIGASELDALKDYCAELLKQSPSRVPRYYPGHNCFEPELALRYLQESTRCETAPVAMRRLGTWVKNFGRMKEVIPVVDTTFFDSGWINYYCALAGLDPIFGHNGIDLRSMWAGMTNNPTASLKTVGVRDDNMRPHHALHDAVWLSQAASMVLYRKMA